MDNQFIDAKDKSLVYRLCAPEKMLRYSTEEKINIVLEWMESGKAVYTIAAKYNISKAAISKWKKQFFGDDVMKQMSTKQVLSNTENFEELNELPDNPELLKNEITALKQKVRYLQMECDAFEKAAEIAKKVKRHQSAAAQKHRKNKSD